VIRVLKTTRQTAPTTITYREAAKQVIDQDGLKGLFPVPSLYLPCT